MPFKRKASSGFGGRKRARMLYRSKQKRIGRGPPRNLRFSRRVMRVVNRNAERKAVFKEFADNLTMVHNRVTHITSNVFNVSTGPLTDVQNDATGNAGGRIGNRIYVKGISVRIILESQQYRPNCDYWLYLVRNRVSPIANISSSTDMFEGLTGQIPTDFIDKEKVHVLFCKKICPRMPNPGVDNPMDTTGAAPSDGNAHPSDIVGTVPNPKVIRKWYIRVNRTFQYQDASNLPVAAQRYQWVICAYNNNSTVDGGATWPCGHLWLCQKLIFTDV